MSKIDTSKLVESFEGMSWHDAKLLGFSHARKVKSDEIRLLVSFFVEGEWAPPKAIVFGNCINVKMTINLEGKRACSDSISEAYASLASDWIKEAADENSYYDYWDSVHFVIDLVPPGGGVEIIAKSYWLEEV